MNYIYSADDFGPIDFINNGIKQAVEMGVVNSVQVLSNFDKEALKHNLWILSQAVDGRSILDIGIHLTLSSGRPIYTDPGKSIEQTWVEMVDSQLGFSFNRYTDFYFYVTKDRQADHYFRIIENEFNEQIKRLAEAIKDVDPDGHKFVFRSSSFHHNLHMTSERLFALFTRVARMHNLYIRSPRGWPHRRSMNYSTIILPWLNGELRIIKAKDIAKTNRMVKRLHNGIFPIDAPKSRGPFATEMSFYNGLGTLLPPQAPTLKRINKKIATFNRRKTENLANYGIAEYVFHLGQSFDSSRYRPDPNYSGVNHRYFDDRKIEFEALRKLSLSNFDHFADKVSWKGCNFIN